MNKEQKLMEWLSRQDPFLYKVLSRAEHHRSLNAGLGTTEAGGSGGTFWGSVWNGVKVVGTEVAKAGYHILSDVAKMEIERKIREKYGSSQPPAGAVQAEVNAQAAKNQAVIQQAEQRVVNNQPINTTKAYTPQVIYDMSPEQEQQIDALAKRIADNESARAIQTQPQQAAGAMPSWLPLVAIGFLAFKFL